MRFHHVLLRPGVIAVLALLTISCNGILGIEDVSSDCHINSDFPRLASNSLPTTLYRFMDNGLTGPELDFQLDTATNAESDKLVVRLYDNQAPHGILNVPGTYPLIVADAKFDTCGICAYIDVQFDTPTGTETWNFQALGQGDLMLTTADNTRLAGSMHNLKFRHTITGDVDVNDGCTVTIEDIEFDMVYGTAAR